MTFADFNLPKPLADALAALNFETPTPIQEKAIPHAMDGRDVLGSAQTGTGKTGAFMIPVIAKLLEDERACALVMSPTRELASQIMDTTKTLLGQRSSIRTALLIGGDPMFKQMKQLSARPRLIIGTPGRIDDHCRRNRSMLDTTQILVLDEADRMLDMGFSTQIDSILKYMPEERHTLMFSATFSDKIIKFAQKYLNNPVRVAVKPEKITADRIKHDVVVARSREDKYDQLLGELENREGSVIIFVKTRRNADQLAEKLCKTENDNYSAQPIHSDLKQRQRDRTIKAFRAKEFRVLVATDVASRGLDIPHVEHVINFDLPQNPEDYVHRIGRTARAGAEGQAMCFVTPSDGREWSIIERLVFPNKTPTPYNDNGPSKKSGKGRGRGKPSGFRPDFKDQDRNGGQGKFGKRRKEGSFSSRDDKPAFKKRDDRPARDSEDRPARSERTAFGGGKRFEGRSENRGEKRFEGRNENRSENRFEGRGEGRSEKRNDTRAERPAFKKRDDRPARNNDERPARSDRPAFGGGKRFEGRSENRGEKRFEGRNANRSDKPAFKNRDDRPARSNSEGGETFPKRKEWQDRSEGKAATGDKRTPRSESFKNADGFKKKSSFNKGDNAARKPEDGFKKTGGFKKSAPKGEGFKKSGGFGGKKGGFSKPARSFKKAG